MVANGRLHNPLPKQSGIYFIRNKLTRKMYIGKANDMYARVNAHISQLRRNISECTYLQNAWNKYGERFFEAGCLEECPQEQLLERERYYIKKFQTKRKRGYNLTDGGDGARGTVASRNTRRLISLHHADFSGINHPRFGKKHEKCSSKYYGVSKHSSKGFYRFRITYDGVTFEKCIKGEIEAALAYDQYVIAHGLKNPLNFPDRKVGNAGRYKR